MDEDAAIIESIMREEAELNGEVIEDPDGGWETVSHTKRRNLAKYTPEYIRANGSSVVTVGGENSGVFYSIEKESEERRRRVIEAQKAALEAVGVTDSESGSKDHGNFGGGDHHHDDDRDVSDAGGANVGDTAKKTKEKVKKPKITVAEAASKIDAGDLAAYLIDISSSYELQQDIQLIRFADYFGRAFAPIASSQFPWVKMLKESSVAKMVDIPLALIPGVVYKTSLDWLNQRSIDALGAFVLWSWDCIIADSNGHTGNAKSVKKQVQPAGPTSLKSQVAIFVVLSMTLRSKPDVLTRLLPILKDSPIYSGQDKLPIIIWTICQACQGDLVVGLYMWVQILLPMLNGKSGCSPQSRDLIFQLVERIVSSPKGRSILLNGAVRKGERLVPPSAFEVLMKLTFASPSSSQAKGRERFEAVYPILKEVALAGAPRSKAMKQVLQQTLSFCIKVASKGNPNLSNEASNVLIWCLEQNPDCYEQWDSIYLDNVEASVVVLRKMSSEWKDIFTKSSELKFLQKTVSNFRLKNGKALASKEYASRHLSLKEADDHCKTILSRLSRGSRCLKGTMLVSVVLAVVAVVLSRTMQCEDIKGVFDKINVHL